tara:strand:- start:386 stop:820 length:435 start_codon:yes stop_codon:yes gene_type:complete
MIKRGIIVSGYFNPLHKGHIEYFNLSKKEGDFLIVIVNNDLQRNLKKSKKFMDENERLEIISSLRVVDFSFLSIDKDRTVSKTIELIHEKMGNSMELIFANGGDQADRCPEELICNKLGIKLIYNMGDKIQSSSWLLNKSTNGE